MSDIHEAYLRAIETDGAALLAAVEAAPHEPVPACPGWDTTTLAAHIGRIWNYVSEQAESTEPLDPQRQAPEGMEQPVWARQGLEALLATLGRRDPEDASWNWARGQDKTAAFWFRRMAQETAMHRWDAQSAVNAAEPITSWLAADGIEEVATMWLPRRRGQAKEEVIGTAHLHAADPAEGQPSEWFLELGSRGAVTATHAHQKGDAVLRGAASDILLRLWGRPSGVEAFGTEDVLSALRAE